MAKVSFLKSGGFAALAAALALIAMPASAQDSRGGGSVEKDRPAASPRGGGQQGGERPGWRPAAPAAKPAAQPPVMRRIPAPQSHDGTAPSRGWQGRGGQGAQGGAQGVGDARWQGRGNADGAAQGRPDWRGNGVRPPVASVPPQRAEPPRRGQDGRINDGRIHDGRSHDGRVNDGRNSDGVRHANGTPPWRANRDNRGHDPRWQGGDNRHDGWRDGDRRGNGTRWQGRDGWRNGEGHRWNREWRNDRRYNWRGHREHYRHVYRPGRYYAPYRNYYYQPVGIGFYLNSLFYSQKYWLSEPGNYRLPPVDGPYRWVRYYDDVLLVDIYSGEVVDVIDNFFW